MEEFRPGSLLSFLATVPDPQSRHGQQHPLSAILALMCCAILCGARSYAAIGQWAQDHNLCGERALIDRVEDPVVLAIRAGAALLPGELERPVGVASVDDHVLDGDVLGALDLDRFDALVQISHPVQARCDYVTFIYIQGAYTIKPWQGNTSDGTWNYNWTFFGGGILLGDGAATSIGSAPGYVNAYNNDVVSTTNYTIAIAAGHDNVFCSNRMISSGQLPDGRTIDGGNSGAYIWNSYKVAASLFYNNSGHDNLVGWLQGNARCDWWVPDATSWTNNTHFSGAVTLNTEAAEWTFWQNKLATGLVTIGTPLK